MNYKLLLVLLLFCPLWSVAQKDTIALQEVLIKSYRQNFAVGANTYIFDKSKLNNYSTQSLSELLSEQSNITINSYGINGLASISMRGAGSNHTAVVWNGINIQNHLNGGVNLALLPIHSMDNLSIQYGGCGALYGSGAVGGAILLNNSLELNPRFKATYQTSYGSFQNFSNALSLNYGSERWAFSSKFSYHKAKNNFPFKNTELFGEPTVNQTNAKENQMTFLQSAYFKINAIQSFTTHLWLEKNDNQIPTQMSNSVANTATQQDNNYRWVALWQRKTSSLQNTLRTAILNDIIIYNNPLIKEYGNHNSVASILESENNFYISDNQVLNIGLNQTNERGKSTNFSGIKTRNRAALFSSYKIYTSDKTLSSAFSFRDELINNQVTTPTFSLGLEYEPLSFLQLKSTFSNNYRVPTFNELYWAVWGNPNLKAEKGWSSDLGCVLSANNYFKFNLTAFNNEITDWILWLPKGTIWTPTNVQKVHSYGLEQGLNLDFESEKWKLGFEQNYSYTISQNRETKQQLNYVPKHKISGTLFFDYKNLLCTWSQNVESERSIDNLNRLEAFTTANFSLSYTVPTSRLNYCISFKINNLLNSSYQIMPAYAMPQRNYLIRFTINFNH